MKTPPAVHGQQLPAWVTPHNIALIVAAAVAVVVILKLASAVGHLSKGAKAAAAPPPAPKKSGGGSGGKLLLLAVAGVGAFVVFGRHQAAAAPAKAAPAPSPTPTPHPTVTQTLAPHITMPGHFPLTGGQIVIAVAIVAVVGFLITRVVVRNMP